MKKILVTGASGFIGSNIIPILREKFKIDAPKRAELDVRNTEQVEYFVKNGDYDAIIHLASPSPIRSVHFDSYDKLFEDCLKIFMNFYAVRNDFGKMIYSGSGAEYNKQFDIINVCENDIGRSIPIDDYGRAKFIMNEMARASRNIYNLRIFGCYGPREYESKFIRHAIRCCLRNEDITIKQDCYFDYMYVDDYAKYIEFCIENDLLFHDYNATSGKKIKLSEIANIVRNKMNCINNIKILKDGMNKEYTASNERIISEMNRNIKMTSISNGIDKLIQWEEKNYEEKSC